jgi:hypothetical protein
LLDNKPVHGRQKGCPAKAEVVCPWKSAQRGGARAAA